MNKEAIFLELLLSGFFAIACLKARPDVALDLKAVAPREILQLTDRVERLRRSRWQWFSMVLIVVLVRLQSGLPLFVELTVVLQLVVFLLLPTQKQATNTVYAR